MGELTIAPFSCARPTLLAGARKTCAGCRFSGLVRTLDGNSQVAGLVVRFEVNAERVRVVGGVVGTMQFE